MSLEDKVKDKESRGFIRKAGRLLWKVGMAAATTALSTWALPLIGASASLGIAVGSAFAVGGMLGNLAKGKSFYDSLDGALTTYSAVNAVIPHMVLLGDLTFPLIDNSTLGGKLLRGLYAVTAYNTAFVASYRGASHLVDNYLNPKGIGQRIKTDFWRDVALIGAMFSPFYYMAANNLTQIAMYHPFTGYNIAPTFAVGAVPVGFAHNYWFARDKPKRH